MACANCNEPTVVCIDADEPRGSGRFQEKYECGVCGAKGYISGDDADPPNQWDRYGRAFEA